MISPEHIIDRISALQSAGSKVYASGLFPSQRIHSTLPYVREDNNIFFSALIVFTLEQLKTQLDDKLQVRIRNIQSAVKSNYQHYLHRTAPDTYNFWKNNPGSHFPNGLILHRISKMALPADTDDTSLIYLSRSNPAAVKALKGLFETQYQPQAPPSAMTHPAYTDLRAYPTFLGKRMVREMDACVITNVLLLMFRAKLPLSQIDQDSLEYLCRVLKTGDYLQAPFSVSPHYGNTAVILYHMARLAASFNERHLNELKELVTERLLEESAKETPVMEKLLIKSSLFRLGQPTSPLHLDTVESHFGDFYFFQAGMLTGLQVGLLKHLAAKPIFHLKYRSEAYYWALVLEHLVLAQAYSNS
jgi:hypothetical protein